MCESPRVSCVCSSKFEVQHKKFGIIFRTLKKFLWILLVRETALQLIVSTTEGATVHNHRLSLALGERAARVFAVKGYFIFCAIIIVLIPADSGPSSHFINDDCLIYCR